MAPKTPFSPEELRSFQKLTQETTKELEKQSKTHEEILSKLRTELEILKNLDKLSKDAEEKHKNQIALYEKELEILKKERIIEEEAYQEAVKKLDIEQKKTLSEEEKLNLLEKRNLLEEDLKRIEDLDNTISKKQKEHDLLIENVKNIEQIKDDTKQYIGTLTGISSDWKNTLWGRISESSKMAGGFSLALKKIGQGIKETLTPSNVLGSTLMKIQESTVYWVKQTDEAQTSLRKATGAGKQYDDAVVRIGRDHLELGIDTAKAAEAIKTLRLEFVDFTEISREAQKELATFSATLNQLGIDNQTTAKNIQISTKVLGLSVEQSIIAQREILATAKTLGVAPQKMAQDFASAAPKLAAFGDQAIAKFRELSTVSKATGLDIDKLLGIVGKFDTFSGAADQVGQLNAILGGNFLDSMQMVATTDPTERLKMLRNAVGDAGLAFDSMSYYQRKAIASAAGLQNVDDLAQLLTGDLEKTTNAAKENAISQEEMNKLAKEAQTIWDKFRSIMLSFAVALQPVIDGIRWLADGVLSLNKTLDGYLVPTLVGATVVWGLFSGTIKNIATNVFGTATKGLTSLTSSVQASGTAAKTSAPGMLAFGAAALMVGGAIALAALGLSKLAESMRGLGIEQIIGLAAVLTLIALGIAAVGFASKVAALPTLAFGVAILAIGFGVKMILDGLANFAISLKDISMGSWQAAAALPFLALGFAGLAVSLALIKTSDLEAVSNIFQSLSKFSAGTVEAVRGVAAAINEIAFAIDQVPEAKAIAFTENVETLTKRAIQYQESRANAQSGLVEQYAQLANVSNNNSAQTNRAGGGERTIIIQLGDRVLKKFVLDVLNEEIDPRKKV